MGRKYIKDGKEEVRRVDNGDIKGTAIREGRNTLLIDQKHVPWMCEDGTLETRANANPAQLGRTAEGVVVYRLLIFPRVQHREKEDNHSEREGKLKVKSHSTTLR